MSELWNRCRALLSERLRRDDWVQSIEPLQAWMDADTLYLWVKREDDDWRAVPNPARDFDAVIRECFRAVCARDVRRVRYLDRPPNREQMIHERRLPEHREVVRRRADRDNKLLLAFAVEEIKRLLENPGRLRVAGSDAAKRAQIEALAIDRAKRRLEREGFSARLRGLGSPPRDPPPPSSARTKRSSSTTSHPIAGT